MQLLGDLLFHISGVTGKMTTETASEDDNFGTAQSNKVHKSDKQKHLLDKEGKIGRASCRERG